MTKNFAIKGLSFHGSDILDMLEMLGGCNIDDFGGENESYAYYIDFNNYIRFCAPEKLDDNYIIFSIDDFIEKFPYKVGDKVKLYYQDEENDRYCSAIPSTIIGMRWDKSHGVVAYKMEGVDREFHKQEFTYNKDENNEPNAVIAGINLNSADYADEVEINLGDYEIEVRNGRTFAVLKKPKYPTTYKECCDVLSIPPYYNLRYHTYEHGFNEYTTLNDLLSLEDKLNTFGKLIICHKAYCKIYGEETGLGKPWKPDWNNDYTEKHCIMVEGHIISKCTFRTTQFLLAFPTREIRDMFLENFRDLIEKCKELL